MLLLCRGPTFSYDYCLTQIQIIRWNCTEKLYVVSILPPVSSQILCPRNADNFSSWMSYDVKLSTNHITATKPVFGSKIHTALWISCLCKRSFLAICRYFIANQKRNLEIYLNLSGFREDTSNCNPNIFYKTLSQMVKKMN